MNGIHQEECTKKKRETLQKSELEKVKLRKLEQNAFAAY